MCKSILFYTMTTPHCTISCVGGGGGGGKAVGKEVEGGMGTRRVGIAVTREGGGRERE